MKYIWILTVIFLCSCAPKIPANVEVPECYRIEMEWVSAYGDDRSEEDYECSLLTIPPETCLLVYQSSNARIWGGKQNKKEIRIYDCSQPTSVEGDNP